MQSVVYDKNDNLVYNGDNVSITHITNHEIHNELNNYINQSIVDLNSKL
jgi:hypothetical protein